MDEIITYFSLPEREKTWKTFLPLLKKVKLLKMEKEEAEKISQERQRLKPQKVHLHEGMFWILLFILLVASVMLLGFSFNQTSPLLGYPSFLVGFLFFNFAPHFLGHMVVGYGVGIRFSGMKFTPAPRLIMKYETYLLASPRMRAAMRLGGGVATLVTLDALPFFAWHASLVLIKWICIISAILISWGFVYDILGAYKILPHRNPDADIIRAKRELG